MTTDLTHEEIEKCGVLFRMCQKSDEKTISIWDAHKPLQGVFLHTFLVHFPQPLVISHLSDFLPLQISLY